jgi:hypothetical protein
MANNENRDFIIDLLKIGARYLLPIAKEAFYEYRRRILDQYDVSEEERAELLDWLFDEGDEPDVATPPADPDVPPTEPVPAVPGKYLTAFPPPVPARSSPRLSEYVEGDRVCAEDWDREWMVVPKGQSTLGAKVLFTI